MENNLENVEVKAKRKYTKKAKKVTYGEVQAPPKENGKFLCATNNSPETITFRHPDPKNNGQADLTIFAWDTEVIDELWLTVAWFVRFVNEGTVVLSRSDVPPAKRDLSVPANSDLSHDRLLDAQALAIVSNPDFNAISRATIFVEPRGQSNMVDKDWLKETGIRFLRNILAREKKWRNRPAVIEACQQRILEINSI